MLDLLASDPQEGLDLRHAKGLTLHGKAHGVAQRTCDRLVPAEFGRGSAAYRVTHRDRVIGVELPLLDARLSTLLDDPIEAIPHLAEIARIVRTALEWAMAGGADWWDYAGKRKH